MTRQELIEYIFDEYSVEPDFPFRMDDVTCVFRHIDNRKWFGIAMVIPYRTIGISKAGNVDILNVKCDPIMMGSLRGKPGFCPAYHMNKDKWITLLLDGSAEQEDIKALLAMSYTMTATKFRRNKNNMGNSFVEIKLFQVKPDKTEQFEAMVERMSVDQAGWDGCRGSCR